MDGAGKIGRVGLDWTLSLQLSDPPRCEISSSRCCLSAWTLFLAARTQHADAPRMAQSGAPLLQSSVLLSNLPPSTLLHFILQGRYASISILTASTRFGLPAYTPWNVITIATPWLCFQAHRTVNMGVQGLWQLLQPVARPIKIETLEGSVWPSTRRYGSTTSRWPCATRRGAPSPTHTSSASSGASSSFSFTAF